MGTVNWIVRARPGLSEWVDKARSGLSAWLSEVKSVNLETARFGVTSREVGAGGEWVVNMARHGEDWLVVLPRCGVDRYVERAGAGWAGRVGTNRKG